MKKPQTKRNVWIIAGVGLLIGATSYLLNDLTVPFILDGIGSLLAFSSAIYFHKQIKTVK